MKKLVIAVCLVLFLFTSMAYAETAVYERRTGKWLEIWWSFTSAADGTLTAEGPVTVSGTPTAVMYYNGTVATDGIGGSYPSYLGAVDPGSGADTSGPYISNPYPTTALPLGTTQSIVSVSASDSSGVNDCKADTSASISYELKTIDMDEASGVWSFTATGLTNNSTTPYYIECVDDLGNYSDDYILNVYVAGDDPGASGIVVDDLDSGCTFTGAWSISSSIAGYNGSGYHYTTSGLANAADTATFTPTIGTAGVYEVALWWTEYSNRPDAAPYTITHSGGTSSGYIDQTANGGQWNVIGSYHCPTGSTCEIEIGGDDAGYTIADAARFVLESGGSQPIAGGFGFTVGGGDGFAVSE